MASPASFFRPGEEAWGDCMDRLQERFPLAPTSEILKALRANNGHAGYAAGDLRDLEKDVVKEADPDDSEWVATLLSNPTMFKATCKDRFQKFDVNRNGTLEWPEVVALTAELSHRIGLEAPSEKSLRSFFFDANDENKDGVLSEKEFTKFFESFLRYVFFMEHRRVVGTWRFQPDPGNPQLMEFRVVQTKDWRLQFRCTAGCIPGAPPLPPTPEMQEVAGTLELQEGWLQAELKQGTRVSGKLSGAEVVGGIRIRLSDNSGEVLVSSFRTGVRSEWPGHVLSRRVISSSPTNAARRSRDAWQMPSRPTTPL